MDPLIARLNSPDYLPEVAYRRNHEIFELVCFVNCLVGCRISENLAGEEVFKKRIEHFVANNPPADDFKKYYDLIKLYIGGEVRV